MISPEKNWDWRRLPLFEDFFLRILWSNASISEGDYERGYVTNAGDVLDDDIWWAGGLMFLFRHFQPKNGMMIPIDKRIFQGWNHQRENSAIFLGKLVMGI